MNYVRCSQYAPEQNVLVKNDRVLPYTPKRDTYQSQIRAYRDSICRRFENKDAVLLIEYTFSFTKLNKEVVSNTDSFYARDYNEAMGKLVEMRKSASLIVGYDESIRKFIYQDICPNIDINSIRKVGNY